MYQDEECTDQSQYLSFACIKMELNNLFWSKFYDPQSLLWLHTAVLDYVMLWPFCCHFGKFCELLRISSRKVEQRGCFFFLISLKYRSTVLTDWFWVFTDHLRKAYMLSFHVLLFQLPSVSFYSVFCIIVILLVLSACPMLILASVLVEILTLA